jgi:hypothetical protein
MIIAAQNIPKMCAGRRVCQIPLLGSGVSHTLIYVKPNIMSKRMRRMVDAIIWVGGMEYELER